MTEEYNYLMIAGYKIAEFNNPVRNVDIVILYTEINYPTKSTIDSTDFITVKGIDVTDFLSREKLHSRDNITNFKTNFQAYLQKAIAATFRLSSHWPYRIIS